MSATGIARRDPAALQVRRDVLRLIDAAWTTQAIATAVRLGLMDRMAAQPADAEQLGRDCACDLPSMGRLLHALACLGLLSQGADGRFALTESGQWLRTDRAEADTLADWALLSGERLWGQWSQLEACLRSGRSARSLTTGSDDFGYLNRDGTMAQRFNRAMANLSGVVADALLHQGLLAGLAWFVDVGGGSGELAARLCGGQPGLRATVQDMPHAQAAALQRFSDDGLQARCDFVAADMFSEVPPSADAYLFKSVLHDWADGHCATILRVCRRCMAADSRLLLVERLMPEGPADSPHARAVARADLQMMVSTGGRERTAAQYERLLAQAGLCLVDVAALRDTDFSCLVAIPAVAGGATQRPGVQP